MGWLPTSSHQVGRIGNLPEVGLARFLQLPRLQAVSSLRGTAFKLSHRQAVSVIIVVGALLYARPLRG
jgi:hypothetical protein